MRTMYIHKEPTGVLDVFGPTVQLLTSPEDSDTDYCVIKGTIPPGVSVPLHSHGDHESFYLLSGSVEVLSQRGEAFEWLHAKPGDFIHIPGGAKHAFRNTSSEPTVQLITTTPKLGRFFVEIGRPISPGVPTALPTAEDLRRLVQVSERYGYWTGNPADNAAVGINLLP